MLPDGNYCARFSRRPSAVLRVLLGPGRGFLPYPLDKSVARPARLRLSRVRRPGVLRLIAHYVRARYESVNCVARPKIAGRAQVPAGSGGRAAVPLSALIRIASTTSLRERSQSRA
jgi:hypothetical protein